MSHKEGISVFVSSHLLSEMQLMCDKVAIIAKGKIVKITDATGGEIKSSNINF